jgi:signal transduction histidine kinase
MMKKRHKQKKNNLEFAYFMRNSNHFRFIWIWSILFNLCLIHIILKKNGIVPVSIVIAGIILIKEFFCLRVLKCMESEIVNPFNCLKKGFEEVMKGNFDNKIIYNIDNEMGSLISSFNKMTVKLKESEKIKIEYEENRKIFITNITHDLRTPITSIQGYAEAILDEVANSPEKIIKYITIILNNSIYMNSLIEDLFIFTKLDMDKLELEYEDVSISCYMDDLMEELKIEIEEQRYVFEYSNMLKNDYELKIDRKKLYRAIRNIINNSLKYAEIENLVIQTTLYKEEEFIVLKIKDNGIGIPKDKIEKIFDRFYRVDSERTKDLMSSGLGLPIAKELIEKHGGSIEVYSEEGNGICFILLLPINNKMKR